MNYTSRTPGVCRSITKLWFLRCGVHDGTGEKEGTVGIAVGNDDIEMPTFALFATTPPTADKEVNCTVYL